MAKVKSGIAELLRLDLKSEQEAIVQYQTHLDFTNDPMVLAVLEHIIADEKEHTAELVKAIRKLDSVQEEKFRKEGL